MNSGDAVALDIVWKGFGEEGLTVCAIDEEQETSGWLID